MFFRIGAFKWMWIWVFRGKGLAFLRIGLLSQGSGFSRIGGGYSGSGFFWSFFQDIVIINDSTKMFNVLRLQNLFRQTVILFR